MYVPALDQLLREIAASTGGALSTDPLFFRATIPTSGAVGKGADDVLSVPLLDDFDYFFHKMSVGVTHGSGAGDLDEINFNFDLGGTGSNLFRSSSVEVSACNLQLAGITTQNNVLVVGGCGIVDFAPGGYAIAGGKRSLTLEPARRASTITTQRILTVGLWMITVPKDYHLTKPLSEG